MYLTHLSLTNFRAFSRLDMEVPRRILLLVGNNAQGKTSLLEAVYFFSTFTSIQASTDRQLLNFLALDEPLSVCRMVAQFQRGHQHHSLEIRLILEQNGTSRFRKEILVDNVKRSAHEAVGLFNAVIFLPFMTRIIEGGPEERRRYLNLALSQTVPGYARALSEYVQALTQRNALLKQLAERHSDPSQLSYWDELLTQRGAVIMHARLNALREMEIIAAQIHRQISAEQEVLQFEYQPAYDPFSSNGTAKTLSLQEQPATLTQADLKSGFLSALQAKRNEEIARGITTLGPHRDELRFLTNQVDLGHYGSRGQIRSTLLSLKLAEVTWMREKTGQNPVLLLDETLAELDQNRRKQLLDHVTQGEQALLTTTDLHLFDPAFVRQAVIWQIQQGLVNEQYNPIETTN
ncbi:MAG: DNA replication/repair protein RecF [Chloroflexi bacterium HGW-Chloroflexi-10]|nr:MAG: DNA replication/repair protein RecF [Chloroflexi bacterium HGW-Chloroflexi-10]